MCIYNAKRRINMPRHRHRHERQPSQEVISIGQELQELSNVADNLRRRLQALKDTYVARQWQAAQDMHGHKARAAKAEHRLRELMAYINPQHWGTRGRH